MAPTGGRSRDAAEREPSGAGLMRREALEEAWRAWSPSDGSTRILAIDAHAEGEPLRVILGGFPELEGDAMLERRRSARSHWDGLRTALMWEPRGHADMYGCLITPPVSARADLGVLFMHNEGFSTMCGHGIIALTRVVLDVGLLELREPLTPVGIDTPAGFVQAHARVSQGVVTSVYFDNVASYVADLDAEVRVPGLGTVRYDLAFGGAFYAYVDAAGLGLGLRPENARDLVEAGTAIKAAIVDLRPLQHPEDPELAFLYGTIFVGPPEDAAHHSRNVCVFADGEVDRSPTGTGVSGRLAIHHARGELAPDQSIAVESILGTVFTGSVVEETNFRGMPAVIPRVEGRAFITGRQELILDPTDPLCRGFLIR